MRASVVLFAFGAALAACGPEPGPKAAPEPSASASVSAAAPAAPRVVKIGEADDGKTVDVAKGDTVELTLPANPSTGYDWQVDQVDKTLGEPTRARGEGHGPAGAVGAPTTVTFTWSLKSPLDLAGDHAVVLAYRRPWEKDEPPERTFKLTLRVAR
ncbi:MAG TPA: protease inhibitor I42 family protein [Minicystis sp.]|nr:protease inhibitor I42 family protein [Minicystis sp.]